jgi:hypothetical protein
MSNHTPGPWRIHKRKPDDAIYLYHIGNNTIERSVAEVAWPDDAKLIAEAPDMYQVVRRLATCDWMSEKELGMWIRKSREIIERIDK